MGWEWTLPSTPNITRTTQAAKARPGNLLTGVDPINATYMRILF